MIYVIAVSILKPGCKDEFVKIAKANYDKVLKEEGCISYVLTEDFATDVSAQQPVNPDRCTFVEAWASVEAWKAHLAAPHMADFRNAVRDFRISSQLSVVTPA